VAQTRPLKLRYTRPALADLGTILDYVAANSPQGARHVHARIKTLIDIGRRTSDPVIRHLTTTPYPYLVFYEIAETEIIVHAVRHAACNPSTMPGSR
jgi:plasmid stabilization system protein ParE